MAAPEPLKARRPLLATLRQLLLFGLLSLGGTAVHYLLLWGWVEGLERGAWMGSVLGATAGMVVNFLLHARWTFAGSRSDWPAFVRFAASAGLGFVVNALLMAAGLALGWHWLAAQLLATGGAFASNYLLAKFWVFRPGHSPP